MKKILAFSGSNSSSSINQQFAQLVGQQVKDAQVDILDLRNYELPIYSIDWEKERGIPQAAMDLKKVLDAYDGFIISLPEHNSSFTAFFKNTIDWISRIEKGFLADRPILLLSTTPGRGGGRSALNHGQKLLSGYLRGRVIHTYGLPSFRHNVAQTEQGLQIQSPEIAQEIDRVVRDLEQALEQPEMAMGTSL